MLLAGLVGLQLRCATHLGHGKRWTPLIFQDVKADGSLAIHVGVVHLSLEGNLGGLEGVVWGKVDGHKEHSS